MCREVEKDSTDKTRTTKRKGKDKMQKETKNNRRKRQANELLEAYNSDGNYEKILKEIEESGDTIQGYITVVANGIVTEDTFMLCYNEAQIKVFRTLPPKPQGGWKVTLTMVDVICDGVNVPPRFNGKPTFRKDIWR